MPVSGLVVFLSDEPQPRAETLEMIGRETRITIGVSAANRLAIVLDTASSEEDQQVWDWLRSLPGVSLVEVAFVGFEQQGQPSQTSTATPFHSAIGIEEGLPDGR